MGFAAAKARRVNRAGAGAGPQKPAFGHDDTTFVVRRMRVLRAPALYRAVTLSSGRPETLARHERDPGRLRFTWLMVRIDRDSVTPLKSQVQSQQ